MLNDQSTNWAWAQWLSWKPTSWKTPLHLWIWEQLYAIRKIHFLSFKALHLSALISNLRIPLSALFKSTLPSFVLWVKLVSRIRSIKPSSSTYFVFRDFKWSTWRDCECLLKLVNPIIKLESLCWKPLK